MIPTAALLGLGVFAIVNLFKSALANFRLLGLTKLSVALILSVLAALPYASSLREGALLVAGVFGLSTLFHSLHKLLQAAGDERRVSTLQRGLRR